MDKADNLRVPLLQHTRMFVCIAGLVLLSVQFFAGSSFEPTLAWDTVHPQAQAQAGTIRILPSPATVGVGETVTVEVWLEDVADYYGVDFRLSFDSNVVEAPLEKVTPLWDVFDEGNHWIARNVVSNTNGTVWYAVTNLNPAEPFTGTGRICSITFSGLAPGTTRLDFYYAKGSTRDGESLYPTQVDGTIVVRPLDFGDAPDPTYPTLLGSNGARHVIVPGFFLGAGVDAEPDGQPDATATGDDVLDGNDDEDGVAFTPPLVPGSTANVQVTTSATGVLNAWMDFNGDGDWADPGEQIFLDQPLVAGPNGLTFPVPPTATPGQTFSRFRFSSIGGLSWEGVAPDGEVEDYLVEIEAPGILGDVNGDDTVNSTDALIILSCDVGIDTSQFCPINCGDVNADGWVNSTDALIILSYDVNIAVPYPVGQPGCPSSVTPCPGCTP